MTHLLEGHALGFRDRKSSDETKDIDDGENDEHSLQASLVGRTESGVPAGLSRRVAAPELRTPGRVGPGPLSLARRRCHREAAGVKLWRLQHHGMP